MAEEEEFYIKHTVIKRWDVYLLTKKELEGGEEGRHLGSFDEDCFDAPKQFGPFKSEDEALSQTEAYVE